MQDEFLGRLWVAHHDAFRTGCDDLAARARHRAARTAGILRKLGFAVSATIAAVSFVATGLVITWTSAAAPII